MQQTGLVLLYHWIRSCFKVRHGRTHRKLAYHVISVQTTGTLMTSVRLQSTIPFLRNISEVYRQFWFTLFTFTQERLALIYSLRRISITSCIFFSETRRWICLKFYAFRGVKIKLCWGNFLIISIEKSYYSTKISYKYGVNYLSFRFCFLKCDRIF